MISPFLFGVGLIISCFQQEVNGFCNCQQKLETSEKWTNIDLKMMLEFKKIKSFSIK